MGYGAPKELGAETKYWQGVNIEPRDMHVTTTILKGMHQNCSVATGDFLQKYINCIMGVL